MRASGKRRSHDELVAISAHTLYEIQMFAATTAMLAEHIQDSIVGDYLKRTVRNALVESFTIHARGLMGFLYDAPKRDDVSALDCFSQEERHAIEAGLGRDDQMTTWRSFRSNAQHPELQRARKRVGKEIAHLTYSRLAPGVDGRIWPHATITTALSLDLHRFADQVPANRVDRGFRSAALMAVMALTPAEPETTRYEPGAQAVSSGLQPRVPVATSAWPESPQ